MKKQLVTYMMLTSLVTTGVCQLNYVFGPSVVHAEQLEELDLSSALRKLGAHAKVTPLQIDQTLIHPTINLVEIPALNSTHQEIKNAMQEWSENLYPFLVELSSRGQVFVDKFDSYYPILQDLNENPEKQEEKTERLEALKKTIRLNQSKIQSYINELETFQNGLTKKISKLDKHVEKGQDFLGKDGKINSLKEEIKTAQEAISKDLNGIALIPGAMNAAGFGVFKEVYILAKDIIKPVAETAAAVVNKGKEIEKSIQDAEKTAEESARAAGKTEQEIEAAKKAARQEIEKDKKAELSAAANAKAKEYDLITILDPKRIDEITNAFGKVTTLTVENKTALNDLSVQNEKLYNMTQKLQIADLQKASMLLMQNDIHLFAEQINEEINLLTQYKKDWNEINTSIDYASQAETAKDTREALKRVKSLRNQLEKQLTSFDTN
ncbi:HBL/NHE enterotoxin family protein [Bacillus thuringiensis]|uniref:Hemolysin BL lytic component L2 n=1 Tax=Bacillus thuringiensis YBT-1518 TaxID=529122 RepID=A0A9W3KJS4_BACTU|nr:HBL/NHE enterotoxin family protein [Bacillus thuringiensis]EKS8366960.1 HBL/NHE enterotoxin family protein [Bacillus cereus]AHA75501.1 hypothetical protein YBT1518_34111 [Bacillus thuringiensis YBT-1518]EKS8372932.1 HBL/NHE enterotoxin family protein [Bacillus cereus]MBG9482504.1 hypothetical protein [Bacillus thuringiensis]MBG9492380.1 hypothetical protein [Bacillus thuringiensis]